jgi:regulation of enolase protein 1 (concanavalin A-like superfamily)
MNKSYGAARAAWMVVCLLINANLAHGQSIPTPWSNRDIGAPTLGGSATSSSGVFSIDAAGADIWSSGDQFHFVYQAVSGDVDIRARIDSLTFADEWSKAGVMIRSSLSADAAHGFTLVSAGRGVAFQRRQTSGGRTAHTPGLFTQAPYWVRLVRSGTTVRAFSSADGANWTEIGSDTIGLAATTYVGIAVTSHNPGMRTTATVSSAALTSAAAPPASPSPTPSVESSADIDSPPISGTTTLASGTYTVIASGAGVAGTADQFRYVYRPVNGNVDVMARVESISGTNPWAIAGLMIRESLAPGSRHAFAAASSREGYSLRYRTETDAEAEQSVISRDGLPGWIRLVRTGTLFEAFRSVDGANWMELGSTTINIGDTAYVGIAVASVADSTATATVSGLTIGTAGVPSDTPPTDSPSTNPPPPNVAPAVILSSPANGETFVAPATVTMSASASDPDGVIVAVEFYVNSMLLGRDTTAPYSFSANSLGAGTYAVKAVATDDDGASTISESIAIAVDGATTSTPPRWAVFQASSDHETLVSRYELEIYSASGVPGVTTPVATSDLGKPTPSSTGEIMVDRSAFFQALPPGNYLAAVLAVGDTATARSAPVSFTR